MKPLTQLKSKFERVVSFFKPSARKEKPIQAMQLNLFLLEAAMKSIQRNRSTTPGSLFTTRILNSKSEHVSALVRQAESLCQKQDIALFSYKEFFCRSHLSLRRAVQWNFSKYVKTKQEAIDLLLKMQKETPAAFKQRLITLMDDDGPTPLQLENEAKILEEQWRNSQKSSHSQSRVAPI